MMRVERLLRAAESELERAEAERDAEITTRTAKIVALVHTQYAQRLDRLRLQVTMARQSYETDLVALGLRTLWTLGDQRRTEWHWNISRQVVERTGREGRLEVCTEKSVFSAAITDLTRPRVGQIFLRILGRDGKPTTRIERGTDPQGWKPVEWYPADAADPRSLLYRERATDGPAVAATDSAPVAAAAA